MSIAPLTPVTIPCCLCGTMILPNAANQCATCLAQHISLQAQVQRGPGGAPHPTVYQCRECRRYKKTDKYYIHAEPESSKLLTLCLQQIPALKNTSSMSTTTTTTTDTHQHHKPALHLVDAAWIWTEPHSMRFKLRLTVRTEIQNVPIEQRVMVELYNQWAPCPDCNNSYRNRTWEALVQVRQKRKIVGAPKTGLATLEMALAKNAQVRKHVLRMDTKQDGFDFYVATLSQAQVLAQYLARVVPIRISTSPKMVSEDFQNNVAHMKYSVLCDMVPICKYDLIVLDKSIPKNVKNTGRLALVTSVKKSIHMIDASINADTNDVSHYEMDLNPDNYYKYEKYITVWQASHRLKPFVVLDVEMMYNHKTPSKAANDGVGNENDDATHASTGNPFVKHTVSEVQVMRLSDLGVSADPPVFHCTTHIGHLLSSGDIVYGYDIVSALVTSNTDWQAGLPSQYNIPDVVLVYKGSNKESKTNAQEAHHEIPQDHMSKKKERRIRRKEGKKNKELVEAAARMGFLETEDASHGVSALSDVNEAIDSDLEAELASLEAELEGLELPSNTATDL
jgi:nonsense-mediated mRNA decay protein 3